MNGTTSAENTARPLSGGGTSRPPGSRRPNGSMTPVTLSSPWEETASEKMDLLLAEEGGQSEAGVRDFGGAEPDSSEDRSSGKKRVRSSTQSSADWTQLVHKVKQVALGWKRKCEGLVGCVPLLSAVIAPLLAH